ncbi:MAG: hypothetical protein FJ304_26040, partial [Planctomycetes bacterium]|nr:hypothetical protein [Planctomycetota bacterium]
APGTPVSSLLAPAPGSARLVTPGAPGSDPAQTLNRPVIFQTARMGTLGIAPPEKTGDGALFPALIVALGGIGRRVAEELKRAIFDRYGATDRVPNVRVLCIDTDGTDAPAGDGPRGLIAPTEFVHTKLNRSAHYLQRDTLPPLDPWLPPGALYKLPRNPGPANGVRAFGRLALLDNYRTVAQRLRQEIETFLTDEPLAQADRATKLGLRTNRPRAYVIAGLAGGTGSGTFLDVAFLLRHELRQVGYMRPEVAGLFFVPPSDPKAPRSAALGNTHAALAELHHFQAKRTRYGAAFDRAEAPLSDENPPFARVAVLQLPKGADPAHARPVLASAARALYHELLTPAGRVADEGRDVYRNAFPAPAPACQTFGLFRLSWPRPEVLAAATRRFAQGQLQRWIGKEAGHLREHIAEWLARQWDERRLSFAAVTETFNRCVRDTLREEPERVFDAFVDPLRTRTPSGGRLDANSACGALDQLLKLVGKPECENGSEGALVATLTARYEELAKETEGHLAVMAATFLEVPQYRLPGAEEAVRQIGEKFKQQVDALEPVRADLNKEVRAGYARLIQTIGALGASGLGAMTSRKANAAEVLDLLRSYPRKRLQLHVLDMALSVFRKLAGNAPEYLREINFCRATLGELQAALVKDAAPAPTSTGPGKMILPDGCKDLTAAADQFLAGLPAEDLLAFDEKLQKDINRKFRGLGSVCLKPIEKGPAFRELMLTKAREFLDTKLDHSDPAAVFFRARTQKGTAEPLLAEAFDEATPDLTPVGADKPHELVVFGAPPGPDGDRLLALAKSAVPSADLIPAPLPDDICFYRELPQVPLTDLPQLGAHAREAYLHMGTDHPPHARTDVPWAAPNS